MSDAPELDGQAAPRSPRTFGRRRVRIVLGIGTAVAVAIVVVVSLLAGDFPYRAVGSGDPLAIVRVGTPLLRLIANGSAVMCVGALIYAAFFTRQQDSGVVSPRGYAAVVSAGRWAIAWLVAAVVLVPFDAANTAGLPIGRVLSVESMIVLFDALGSPRAWATTAVLVAIVAIGCRMALRWRPTVVLAVVATAAMTPPLVIGHASAEEGHDVATAALLIHVPAAVVWMGVLVAMARWSRDDADAVPMARRYGRLALACWTLLAITGLSQAFVQVPLGDLFTTGYGAMLAVKIVLAAVIGVVGLWLRGRIVRSAGARRGAAIRLIAAELLVLAATYGISVGMTHVPPTALVLGRRVSTFEQLLGYDLNGPPTLIRLLLDWRLEVFFALLCVVLVVGYLVGVRRLRRAGQPWPWRRTAAWLAGCAVLLIATNSGLGTYATAQTSVHLSAHMLLGMLAPILLALGGPLTLAGQALRRANPGDRPGPREWLIGFRDWPALRLITHPLVAVVLYAGSPFLLYFTDLYDGMARYHWAHLVVNLYFLLIGYLFAWVTVGVDRLPAPSSPLQRLGIILAAMPADIVFAASIITTGRVLGDGPAGANFFSALALPWVPNLLADQRLGGILALGLAEASLLVALVALIVQWQRGGFDDTSLADVHLRDALARRSNRSRRDDQEQVESDALSVPAGGTTESA